MKLNPASYPSIINSAALAREDAQTLRARSDAVRQESQLVMRRIANEWGIEPPAAASIPGNRG